VGRNVEDAQHLASAFFGGREGYANTQNMPGMAAFQDVAVHPGRGVEDGGDDEGNESVFS